MKLRLSISGKKMDEKYRVIIEAEVAGNNVKREARKLQVLAEQIFDGWQRERFIRQKRAEDRAIKKAVFQKT